jgi:hypothetical protein
MLLLVSILFVMVLWVAIVARHFDTQQQKIPLQQGLLEYEQVEIISGQM